MRRRPPAQPVPITSPAVATVFTMVLTQGPISRVDVARSTGLSSAAVTKAARPLIEAGYLEELPGVERKVAGAGRLASPLAVRAERESFIGIKVTGDEVIGVLTDLRADARAIRRLRPAGGEVGSVVAAIADVVADLDADGRCGRIGIAISGDVDRAGGKVRYSPFLGWRDVPLAELVEDATGLIATVENDVKALAMASHWFGDGVGADTFALVTVGSGIGCALVIDGRLVAGARGVAGEIGHIPVGGGEPPCACGGRGCVEAIASEHAIVTKARAVTGRLRLEMSDAIDLAHGGDEGVRTVFAEAGHAIGLGLAAMVNLVGPERVVVSGEGLAAYDLFEEHLRTAFESQAFGSAACPLIVRPLPFEEWARGAAAVSIQEHLSL
ncbi:MAG: family transcriptional regulator [Amycolatopsis sp.]|uniref:ROK family protein n=1 Tax=Amycolatopsis sp. TaxID=37632 RepID=UPI002633A572|nr:ROK family protein [Amycolatopsis sp.]MCU1684821.1 family transcriptional regulator [Amycolatopsis sp.]